MHLIYPKRDIIIPHIKQGPHLKIKGEARFVLMDLMGRTVYDSGYKKNLITNNGLAKLTASDSWATYCALGDSNQAPAVTDTSLIGNNLGQNSSFRTGAALTVNGAPNYEFSQGKGWRWNAGVATGTIREAIVYTSNLSYNDITSRILVTPEITKSVDQVLDVYWRWTIYPDLGSTVTNNVNIPLDGVDTFYNVTSCGVGYYYRNSPSGSSVFRQLGVFNSQSAVAWDGPLTSFDPTSNNVSGGRDDGYPNYWDMSHGGYTFSGPDSGYRDVTISAGLDAGNTGHPTPPGNGIRVLEVIWDHNYAHAFQFDDVIGGGTNLIPKDNTRLCSIVVRNTWSRM